MRGLRTLATRTRKSTAGNGSTQSYRKKTNRKETPFEENAAPLAYL